jgi:metal-sulfur cluster biosynthetic enzyme
MELAKQLTFRGGLGHRTEEAAMSGEEGKQALSEEAVRKALRQVKDPEAGMNIVDLGLIYDVAVDGANVDVKMTLTSPGCPASGQILGESEQVVRSLPGVEDVTVELVWEPFWTPERIDPKVRAFLGL